jgi:threonine/homoserine/homoserine lactone efflux protein
MWYAVGSGILIGLSLSILTGPLLITLIQAGLEKGKWAGFMVAMGIWLSDIAFIAAAISSFSLIEKWVAQPAVIWALGLGGGLVLIGIGLGLMLSRQVEWKPTDSSLRKRDAFSYWMKGFLVNTLNPFTFFFWLGLMGSTLSTGNLNQTLATAAGIIGTLMLTDSLKILLAEQIGKLLTSALLLRLRKISGAILLVFGVILVVRTFLL